MLVDQIRVFVVGTIKFPAVDERRRRRASTEQTYFSNAIRRKPMNSFVNQKAKFKVDTLTC